MKTVEPTPSNAAYILRRFLQSKELYISLSTAQEAVARLRGFNDWNSLAAELDPRGTRAFSGDLAVQTTTMTVGLNPINGRYRKSQW